MHTPRYSPYQTPLNSQYSPKYDRYGYMDMGIDSRQRSEYGSVSPPNRNVRMDSRHNNGYQSPPKRNMGDSSRRNSGYQSVSPPNCNYGQSIMLSAYDYSQEDQDFAYEMLPPPYGFMSPTGTGKTANNKDSLEDKKDESELWEAQAAFLGPNLWDKTLPYDSDLKYVDLDEFLSENGMPGDGLASGHLGGPAFGHSTGLSLGGLPSQITKRERSPSPSECMSPDTINPPLSPADSTFSMASSGRDFDPRTRAFSDEELKPQPMIKKSRKQFVPDDLKDDKYWARRRKNNMAAKRSRDARRMKENQIALRAGYLEKENMGLRQELEILKKENHILREKLSKLTDV